MTRPIGIPKTGGRKRGTPNKKTSILLDRLEGLNFDVVEELIKCLDDPEYKMIKPQILMKLLDFIYPKIRQQASIELPLQQDQKITFVFEEIDSNT